MTSALGYLLDLLRDAWFAVRTPRWIRELENEPEGVDPDGPDSSVQTDSEHGARLQAGKFA